MIRTASISNCQQYRYRLGRIFGDGPELMFVMVNPSTADADVDDQTIKKCIGFAKANGFGSILVGNKFAYRSTDVKKLREVRDPVGPENDEHLRAMMERASKVVVGWGQLAKLPEPLRGRWKEVVRLADAAGHSLHTIGVNADKHPKHPQMTGYDEPISPWTVPWFPNRGAAAA
jgi:hypothetical protein